MCWVCNGERRRCGRFLAPYSTGTSLSVQCILVGHSVPVLRRPLPPRRPGGPSGAGTTAVFAAALVAALGPTFLSVEGALPTELISRRGGPTLLGGGFPDAATALLAEGALWALDDRAVARA